MRAPVVFTAGLAALTLLAAGPLLPSLGPVAGPLADQLADCDDLDPAVCLLPFPNDVFTVEDDSTPTGKRIAFAPAAMPSNIAGKPIDPTEWNRNDGFSPGSMVLTHVPGLDLAATFGTDVDNIAEPSRYLQPDAPMVIIDASTGERHPFWAELDHHAGTPDDQRLLILRPLVNFREGHRYIVALRDLRDGAGTPIEAGSSFRRFRDGPRGNPGAGLGSDNSRASHFQDIFATLAGAGIARDDLYLAWDFTVASGDNLAGRVLAMRDDAFGQLGDDDLGDGIVDGDAPSFTIDYVDEADGNSLRVVHGAVTVPNYLDRPQVTLDAGRFDRQGHDVPSVTPPGSRLYYGTPLPGPTDTPVQNPVAPTMEVPFACAIPTTTVDGAGEVVEPAIPVIYGHGLLGQRIEGAYWSGGRHMLVRQNAMNCGVDWIGMAQQDLANVGTMLADPSNFPSLADRVQQGLVGFLMVGRAMIHQDGFAAHEAFRDADGDPLLDTSELFYDGNSQGGIMGGALTAIAPDFTKAVLGVPGMNYSTLLNRSVDWEGSYGDIYYAFQPDPMQRQLSFALLQMLWDRAESNGYAQHMTDEPYDNTPAHQVLLHVAFGDYQVANIAAEVMGRTVGARLLDTSLAAGRHWSSDPTFGFDRFEDGTSAGSALVYFDSGNLTPPNGNVPPEHVGSDPHGHPRGDVLGGVQKRTFFDTGVIVDTRDGQPYWTRSCADPSMPVNCPDGPNDAP